MPVGEAPAERGPDPFLNPLGISSRLYSLPSRPGGLGWKSTS